MKRIFALLLVTTLLCVGLPTAQAAFSREDWYAMGLSSIEEMTPDAIDMAVEYFEAAGTYEQAKDYKQYAQCLSEIFAMDSETPPNISMTKYRLVDLAQITEFTSSLAEHDFPSCADLLTYIEARQLESEGHYAQARNQYQQIRYILDATDRRYNLTANAYEEGKALFERGDYVGATEVFKDLRWLDSEELYQRAYAETHPTPTPTPKPTPTPTPKPTKTPTPKPTATPKPTNTPTPKPTATPTSTPKAKPGSYFGTNNQVQFSMSSGVSEELLLQLVEQAQQWTEKTAPQTLDEFPLYPEGFEQLYLDAINDDMQITEDKTGCIWYTNIGNSFATLGFNELSYRYRYRTTLFEIDPVNPDQHSIRLENCTNSKNLEELECHSRKETKIGQRMWLLAPSVYFYLNNGIVSSVFICYCILSYPDFDIQVEWGISSSGEPYFKLVTENTYVLLVYDSTTNVLSNFESIKR